MKKLFLTSNFFEVADKLQPFLSKNPKSLNLAFIPTASNLSADRTYTYADKSLLETIGFKVTEIDLVGLNSGEIEEKLKNQDVIFVGGGNTYYLLDQARKSGFDKIVKRKINEGIVYIGSSAGSILVCPRIDFIEDLDDPTVVNLTDFSGLNLVDFLLLPHFDDSQNQFKNRSILKKWEAKYKVIPLPNDQVVCVENGKVAIK
jgi:dipeptidase E